MNLQPSSSKPTNGSSTGRIEYIDALRGFTMLLVVFNHIAKYSFEVTGIPSFHQYLTQVRMPMFFFISGFVLYKSGVVWDGKHVIRFFRKNLYFITPSAIKL